jgi:hypothetical protein
MTKWLRERNASDFRVFLGMGRHVVKKFLTFDWKYQLCPKNNSFGKKFNPKQKLVEEQSKNFGWPSHNPKFIWYPETFN